MKTSEPDRTLLETMLHFLSILLKYRWLIIGVTAFAAIGVVGFCILSIRMPPERSPLPNIYTAESIILVQGGSQSTLASSIMSSLGIEPSGVGSAEGYDIGALLLMVLRSRTFVDKIIEEFDIARRYNITEKVKTTSRERLLQKMTTTYDRPTRSITISFEDIEPVFARDVTNRIVTLLNEWFAQNIGNSNLQQRKMLQDKVNEVKDETSKLERQLRALQTKYGVLSAQDLGTSQASALAELRSQLILKEIEIKNYSTISAIEDPKLQQLREERQNILDTISKVQTTVTDTQGNTADPKRISDVQMELNNLNVELDVQRKIYDTLSHQYEVMKLASEPQQAFQILELAEIPDAKSGPQRSVIVLEVTLAAFVASSVLAFLLNSLAQLRRRTAKVGTPRGDVT